MPVSRFSHGSEIAQKTAKAQLEFILTHLRILRRVDSNSKLQNAAMEFKNMIDSNEKLSPKQLAFVESIYEKVFKGAGFESISPKHDFKKKLKY